MSHESLDIRVRVKRLGEYIRCHHFQRFAELHLDRSLCSHSFLVKILRQRHFSGLVRTVCRISNASLSGFCMFHLFAQTCNESILIVSLST